MNFIQTKLKQQINIKLQKISKLQTRNEMFSDFENMFDKIKNTVKQQVNKPEQHYSNTPQKYQIAGREIHEIKLLSQGAFGFIWLAEDFRTKQQFALKRVICMTEERLRESKKQKDVMSVLPKSKNVVEYFGGDIISRDGQRVVVTLMELCDGGTLFDQLQKREGKGFTQQQLINIMLDILHGLQSIHSTGYYHRDIKIQNVLLGKDKNYKLCDFGSSTKQVYNFAEISKADYDSIKQQIEGMTTPMYRPPQIVDPYSKYLLNYKADIWMVGCVLYTLCYFVHPFVDSNAIGIASGTYRFPKYPGQTKYIVSQKIKDLIRHILTPNPSFRPSTKQLIQILTNWNSLSSVPMNSEAMRRKREQLMKEKELQKLNKNCVQFEGDIPLQKIMELQKRLKKPQVQDKPTTTFVNKKQIKDQNAYSVKVQANHFNNDVFSTNTINKSHFQTNNVFNSKNPFESVSGKPVQKKQANINQLWGPGFNKNQTMFKEPSKVQKPSINNNSNSFDFFNNFGNQPSKSSQQKSSQQQINFEEMFSETPTPPNLIKQNSVKNQSKKMENLLDF